MANHYVRKDGNNSHDGHTDSAAGAWLTIDYAMAHIAAGDTVIVHTGTYAEHVTFGITGTAGNIVTLQIYPGDTVVVDGTGIGGLGDDHGLIHMPTGISYATIDGLEVRDAEDASGIVGYGVHHYVTVKNCKVHETGYCGIFFLYNWTHPVTMGNVTHITIDGCETYNTNTSTGDEAIALIGTDHFEIMNCIVHDTGSIAIDMKQGTTIGSCHDCTVYSAGSGIYIDAREHVADNILIYNNICYDISGSAGIIFESESWGSMGITNLSVFNNVVYHCNDGIYFGSYSDPDVGGPEEVSFVCVNNTLYDNALGLVLLQTYDRYTSGVIRNNIICGTSAGQSLLTYAAYNDTTKTDPGGNVVIDHNSFYGGGSTKYGTDYTTTNPTFVNAGAHNFALQTTSPCKNAGSATLAPATDIIGTPRPQGAADDIGAYEFIEEEAPAAFTVMGISSFTKIMGVTAPSKIMGVAGA